MLRFTSDEYDDILINRARFGPNTAYVGLDHLTMMALENHYMDLSTGTLRERAAILLSGAKDDPGQHGHDAMRGTRPVECKPILFMRKVHGGNKKNSANGYGSINDHTWDRHTQFIEDDLIMQQSQFFDGQCAWIAEFSYCDQTFLSHIEKQLSRADDPKAKVRRICGRFNYLQWFESSDLVFRYINKGLIESQRLNISGGFHKKGLYKFLISQ